jgi:hypothetical protein
MLWCALAVCAAAPAQAQSTDFVLSTAPLVFPTPTLSNFTSWPPSATGPVTDSIAVPFTVDRVQQTFLRFTTVAVRCTGVSGAKACGDIQWRSGPTGAWNTLTLVDAEVESRWVWPLLFNDPWSGTLWLRVRLNWADPAPAVMTSNIALTLSVYRP